MEIVDEGQGRGFRKHHTAPAVVWDVTYLHRKVVGHCEARHWRQTGVCVG